MDEIYFIGGMASYVAFAFFWGGFFTNLFELDDPSATQFFLGAGWGVVVPLFAATVLFVSAGVALASTGSKVGSAVKRIL